MSVQMVTIAVAVPWVGQGEAQLLINGKAIDGSSIKNDYVIAQDFNVPIRDVLAALPIYQEDAPSAEDKP